MGLSRLGGQLLTIYVGTDRSGGVGVRGGGGANGIRQDLCQVDKLHVQQYNIVFYESLTRLSVYACIWAHLKLLTVDFGLPERYESTACWADSLISTGFSLLTLYKYELFRYSL